MRKVIVIFLISGIIGLSTPVVWAPSAQATGLPVIDLASIAQAAWEFTTQTIAKAALSALKKRIIDTMTDEIITWINGGGSPKFITNFSQEVFQPALNQAVGDTVQQIMPSLCSPYSFNVNLALTAPQPLSQPSNCTLNSIVANFNDFRKNFNIGGAIGYSELLQPQNNQYGVDILTQDTLYNNVQTQTAKDTLQTQVNVGFNSQKCLSWKAVDIRSQQILFNGKTVSPSGYDDPSNPPPVMDSNGGFTNTTQQLIQSLGGSADAYRPSNFQWQCADLQITTPGRSLVEGLNKSLYANLDLTINDQDISNALAMIADAAFNRLIRNSIAGVLGLMTSKTSGGGPAGGQVGTGTGIRGFGDNGEGIPTSTKTEAQTYTDTVNNALANQYLTELNQASSSLNDASTTLVTASSTNTTLASSTLPELIKCLGANSSSSDLAWAQGNLTIAVSSTPLLIDQTMTQVASSSVTVNTFISTLNSPNSTPDTLKNINPADISGLLTNASDLDNQAQTILSNVQATLETTQTKINQCQARS